MQISGVYKIENIANGKFYIGSTVNFFNRKKSHFGALKNKRHSNLHLQNAWNKYGKDCFKFKILATCPLEYNLKLEQWFINNLKPEYNICSSTSSPMLGRKHTIDSLLKMKIANEKNWKNDKFRKSVIENNCIPILCYSVFGKFLREFSSTKEAATELNLFSTNITQVLKGKNHKLKGYIFKYKTDNYTLDLGESYLKVIQDKKRQILSQNGKKNNKPIQVFKSEELLGTFNSLKEASQALNISPIVLCAIKRGKLYVSVKNKIGKYSSYKVRNVE